MKTMGLNSTAPAIDKDPIFMMLDWISHRPTADDLVRGLVTDYLRPYGALKARFALLSEDDSLHHIAAYGFTEKIVGTVETADQWRNRKDIVREVVLDDNFIGWSPDYTVIGAAIRERGISKGSVVIFFDPPVKNHDEVLAVALKLVRIIGFYLCNSHQSIISSKSTGGSTREVSRGDFTSRQLQIMQGMVEGKTNHELATDLGYSVSTVRHETMRIFQILGVSDRREAARSALDRSII
jgi:DNA-binding CsgD family transcriptional regulator